MQIAKCSALKLMTVAFVLGLACAGNTMASVSLATITNSVVTTSPQEEVKKLKGVVVKRDPDAFTMSETTGGPTITVLLTPSTEVKSHKKGVFRGSKEYAASYILRGLRLEIDGVRNSDGTITASKVRFDEQDLRTAQALKATVWSPYELRPDAADGLGRKVRVGCGVLSVVPDERRDADRPFPRVRHRR